MGRVGPEHNIYIYVKRVETGSRDLHRVEPDPLTTTTRTTVRKAAFAPRVWLGKDICTVRACRMDRVEE